MPDYPRHDLIGVTATVSCNITPGCAPGTPCPTCAEIMDGPGEDEPGACVICVPGQCPGPDCPGSTLEHTHHNGPLCAYWYASHSHIEDPGTCIHGSCAELVHEDCLACQVQAMAAEEADRAVNGPFIPARLGDNLLCPDCGRLLRLGGFYGAPGVGQPAGCPAGHHWAYVGGALYRPEAGAHIMTEWDAR